jgi:hypothetical protein
MEEVTISGMTLLTSYGPMGVLLVYFAYKDLVVNKKLTEALSEISMAMNSLCVALGGNKSIGVKDD